MRRVASAIVVSALMTFPAWGQTIDPQKAQAWLQQKFGIKSERVVEATPDELVVLESREPKPPSDFRAIVHLENFGPPDPLTPPSSDEEYFINCPSRRFHVERIESFSENGARGAQSTSFGPSTWGKPVPNSTEARVVSAVCGPEEARAAVSTPSPPPPEVPPLVQQPPPPPVAQDPPPPVSGESSAPTPPAPPDPPQSPARGATTRVQLFAGDRAAAERFAKAVPARLAAAGLIGEPEVVQATVGGRRVYRVQMRGLSSAADADRFCSAVKAAGLDCFVPRKPPR